MENPRVFRQYIWLIDLLYRERELTLEEINRRWKNTDMSNGMPIPRTTFWRHREIIQDMFDITIESRQYGREHRYCIVDRDNLNRSGVKKWMLDTISIGSIVTQSAHLHDRILLENIPSGQEFLTAISYAMQASCTIMMEYQKFDCEPTRAEVEPFCLKLYHQRWYLLAHKPGSKHVAVYSLDRINKIEQTRNSFTLPEGFDAQEYFSPYFGVFRSPDTPLEHVVLRVSPRLANYYRTLPLHQSQRETSCTAGYVEFTVDLCPTYDFRQELLSQMDSLEVVSPQWLRDEMRGTIRKMLAQYE